MSQQRITLFFPSISKGKTSPEATCYFLELPFKIRRQIYHEAGLVSGETIHLNFWGAPKKEGNSNRQGFETWGETRLPPLPLSLFVVCRSVNAELTKILYSENRFTIARKAPRGLLALERLSGATLQEMRFLIVRLNLSSCKNLCCGPRSVRRRCGNFSRSCTNPSSHDPALSAVSRTDQLVISQWQQICTRLANSIQPSKLELYIICDCADQETADKIVRPLLLLPILRNCGLRLALEPDNELQRLAKDVVLRLTDSLSPLRVPPFRFLDLPKELQIKILGYTALINCNEVFCDQTQMKWGGICQVRGMITYEAGYNPQVSALLKCFCNISHSAFNARCRCEGLDFPLAMFLVSCEFRDIVIEVFYGRNRFLVTMQALVPTPEDLPLLLLSHQAISGRSRLMEPSELSIIPGLARFPPGSIKYLTSIILKFEWPHLSYLQPDHAGWRHWLDTINLLAREANLGALTLELRLSECSYISIWDVRQERDAESEVVMLQTYERLIEPMVALSRLKKLFVHLNWGASFRSPNRRQEQEQRFERMVMGQTYDAWKCGKEVSYAGAI